jgi:hypothetical protein
MNKFAIVGLVGLAAVLAFILPDLFALFIVGPEINPKKHLEEFAKSEPAAALGMLMRRNSSATQAAMQRNAESCVNESAGVELPQYQQHLIVDSITFLAKTVVAGKNQKSGAADEMSQRTAAYMSEHGQDIADEAKSASAYQMAAARRLMEKFYGNPSILLTCIAERTAQELDHT